MENEKRKMTKEEFVEQYKKDMKEKKLIERELFYKKRSEYLNNPADMLTIGKAFDKSIKNNKKSHKLKGTFQS